MYRNAPDTDRFLDREKPSYIGGMLEMANERLYPFDEHGTFVDIGTADAGPLDAGNVIWCTGFRQDFSWIDLDVFDADGLPRHERGVVEEAPGLYFVGLRWLHRLSSSLIGGVGRDARHVARHVARRVAGVASEPGSPDSPDGPRQPRDPPEHPCRSDVIRFVEAAPR